MTACSIPLVPLTRPNGRQFRPRKITVERWENSVHNDACGVVVLGTHDVEAARVLAQDAIQGWADTPGVVPTKPEVGWWRLTYAGARGHRCWTSDESNGRAGVMFTADYDTQGGAA